MSVSSFTFSSPRTPKGATTLPIVAHSVSCCSGTALCSLQYFQRRMAAFTRTTGTQQSSHGSSNAALTTYHFAEVVRGHMKFQYQCIAIIAHFAHLHSRWVIYQRLSDILNQFTHLSTFIDI